MKNGKKTHWLRNTLLVLIVCGLAGLTLSVIQFGHENARTYAQSSLQFSFKGAEDGLAPDGYPFDLSGLTSDTVLAAALKSAGLEESYTPDQLKSCISVSGIYPEDLAKQMTRYVSLLDPDQELQARVADYHATQYQVQLSNAFDRSISAGKLTGLLDAVLAAYRDYFQVRFTPSLEPAYTEEALKAYDYAQQLEAMDQESAQMQRYAETLFALAPDYQRAGASFGDIGVAFQSLDTEINRLSAYITLNAVSTDRERLLKRYEMEIRTRTYQLNAAKDELKQVDELVDSFEKEGIIYLTAGETVTQVGGSSSAAYDRLVARRKALADSMARNSAVIEDYRLRIEDLQRAGVTAEEAPAAEEAAAEAPTEASAETAAEPERTEEENAALQEALEQRLETVYAKRRQAIARFEAMLKDYAAQEVSETTLSGSRARYNAPSMLSMSFALRVAKTAGPICAVGFMACLVLLILSRLKEEKARKA